MIKKSYNISMTYEVSDSEKVEAEKAMESQIKAEEAVVSQTVAEEKPIEQEPA